MKKILFLLTATCSIMACNNGEEEKDSIEMAKEVNESLDTLKSNSPDSVAADHNFLVEVASAGMMEIGLGKFAAKNAGSAAVKQFGELMVKDHTLSDSLLNDIARVKNIAIPNVPGDKHQKHIDELIKKKGADFDKDYMSMMVDDHEETIKKFEDAEKNAIDEDIKAFATKTLPLLRKHLETAKKIKDGLK